jgi:hypothetical protein
MRIAFLALALWTMSLCVSPATFAQVPRVPGTRVSLSPPEGFSPAQQYPGFESSDPAGSIMVTELPVPAAEMMRSMTASGLATQGMTLVSSADISLNARAARLLNVRQKAAARDVMKWILVTGETTVTFMLVGTYEASSPETGESIRRALLTTQWHTTSPDPFEGLSFRIKASGKLKLAGRVSNMLMFTESGKPGTPGSTEAMFLAGHSIGSGRIGDVKAFAETRAKQTALIRNLTGVMGRQIQIGGLDAYEIEADATDARNDVPMRLYQVIALDDSGYFILQGLTRRDRAQAMMPEFRSLTSSFALQ